MKARVKAAAGALGRFWTASPRLRAQVSLLAGGAVTGAGTALVYVPAGVILGGVLLAVYGALFVDVDGNKRG